MAIDVGDRVPDHQLRSDTDEPLGLRDYEGRKAVVFFYPKAMTPGCRKARSV